MNKNKLDRAGIVGRFSPPASVVAEMSHMYRNLHILLKQTSFQPKDPDSLASTFSDGLRARVRNVATGEELSLAIPADTLTPEQIEQIKQGEWGKQPMPMQINITRAGNRITKATLVRAGLAG